MATMWPKSLPREVLENPLRSAEIKVYQRLEAALGAPFTVFYSRPWLGLTPSGAEIDGECDFFIAHADFGILALEVKGGAISYDPCANKWASKDRNGFVHSIKDPVAQARSAKHNILAQLRNSTAWNPHRIRANHGVVLPDCEVPDSGLSADAPRRLVCSVHEMNVLRDWILARMDAGQPFANGETRLGHDGMRAMEDLLARPFTLRTPLGNRLADDEDSLQSLTPQQFHILEAIQDIPKAGIAGGAGTGKTVLAMEAARRFAESGCRTLLVCYNNPLSAYLKRMLRRVDNIEIGSFHEICLQFANKTKIEYQSSDQAKFFDETAPELLIRAVETDPSLAFDVVIVDEGQDFKNLWWVALESTLRQGASTRFHVFYDCNQKVYERGGRPPDDVQTVPIRLTRNLRNTKQIHSAAMHHYVGHAIQHNNIDGVDIELVPIDNTAAALQWIGSRVADLVDTEHIAPCDIAILAASPSLVDRISALGRLGGRLLCNSASGDDDAIAVDTIRRFKGLERSVILLLATPELLQTPELAYVAVSRPRTFLSICGKGDVLAAIFPES